MELIQLFILVSTACQVFSTKCYGIQGCEKCVNIQSLLGNCNWCALDKQCHAAGSWLNPCSSHIRVTDVKQCPKKRVKGLFDPKIAYRHVLLSGIAYSDEMEDCMDRVSPEKEYTIHRVAVKACEHGKDAGTTKCVAFVAVSDKYHDIVVSFRGTNNMNQLFKEALQGVFHSKLGSPIGGNVVEYFHKAHDNLYPCLKTAVQELVAKYPNYAVKVTGHSLGGALASIASARLVHDKIVKHSRMTLYTFGMPRVGDAVYAYYHDVLVPDSWRIVHYKDIVVHLPTCSKYLPCPDRPYHHGTEVWYTQELMTTNSTYKICIHGDEDDTCSDSLGISDSSIPDHLVYYNRRVGRLCKNINRRRSVSEFFIPPLSALSKDECIVLRRSDNGTLM